VIVLTSTITGRRLSTTSLLVRAAKIVLRPVKLPFVLQQLAAEGVRANLEVTLPPSHGTTLLDVSMIHPRCSTYVATVFQTCDATAALHDNIIYHVHSVHMHAWSYSCLRA
jgi:hypothetical protein